MQTHQCIITVTKRGTGGEVVAAARRKGARGGTILTGRGSSVYESKKLFGSLVDPEKEIVLTLIEKEKVDAVLDEIRKSLDIDTPGKGIMFVVDVEEVRGLTPLEALK